jgi:hypothetical protein
MEHLRKNNRINHFLSIPFIFLPAIPFILLDLCVEIYHHIAFPLYGIPFVDRSKYFAFDRFKLSYLNILQKTNCAYCSYANGLLKYITEITAQTEIYWCAIKHEDKNIVYPEHHKDFIEYNDEQAFVKTYKQNIKQLEQSHE